MKAENKSENIAKYPCIYGVFTDWVSGNYGRQFIRLFITVALILGYLFLSISYHISLVVSCVMICLWSLVLMEKLIAYEHALTCLENRDGDFDRYIRMMRENAERFKLLPDEDSFIMMESGDIAGEYLSQVEDSLRRGTSFSNSYLVVTDEFLISRGTEPLQFNPVAIPKSLTGEITYSASVVFEKGYLTGYDLMEIPILQMSGSQSVTVKRIAARWKLFGRKHPAIQQKDIFRL